MAGETEFTGERSNAVIALVANKDCVVGAHSDTSEAIEKRGSAVAIKEGISGATRYCSHYAKGGDHADTVIVRNKEAAVGCKGKVAWETKCSKGACAVRPCGAPTARKGGHCAIEEDEPDAVVAIVPHIDIPSTIHGYTNRAMKSRSDSPNTIGKRREAPSASQGGHCTQGSDFTDAVVTCVCHIHHPRRVYSEAIGTVKACRGPLHISQTGTTTSCKCGSHSRGRELSYAVVGSICNVDDTRARVGCDTSREIKTRCNPSAISPGVTPAPCEGAHKTRGGHCPNAVVPAICHIHHPRGVCSNTSRVTESSRSPLTIGKRPGTTPCQGCRKPQAGGLCA